MTTIRCPLEYIPYNQRCYYKFNPTTETRYAVPLDQTTKACLLLNSEADPLIETNVYDIAFIKQSFLYWQPDINNYAIYRVPNFNSDLCTCFNSLTKVENPRCDCYTIQENGIYIFPICSVPQTAFVSKYDDLQVSLATAMLYRYGQEGPRNGGFEAVCACDDTWSDSLCITPTCASADIVEQNPADLNTASTFMYRCYIDNRGTCDNLNPRNCRCNYPYGPDASLLPEFASLYRFRDYPCACPSSLTDLSTFFQINLDLYQVTDRFVPCGGLRQGVCTVSNGGTGICGCQQKLNLQTGLFDAAFDGIGCSCEVPIQPINGDSPNGIIVSQLCNSRGTCCPGGQRWDNPTQGFIGSGACFTNGTAQNGCQCDNAWGGSSCTCPVPENLALDRFKQQVTYGDNTFTYVDLGERVFVSHIRVSVCPFPYFVQVSDFPGLNATSVTCIFNQTQQLWLCDVPIARRYIVVFGENSLLCQIEAFEDYFQYCGYNHTTNIFSGGFFDIPAYRSDVLALYQQYATVASFGCTSTRCYCNGNYGGIKCRSRVNTIRETLISDATTESVIWAKRYCMENILMPTLYNEVSGGGSIDSDTGFCQCTPISTVDVTGKLSTQLQTFSGEACNCANVLNPVTGDVSTCANLGTCVDPDIPYAWCEVDYFNYTQDPLFRPFTQQTSIPPQITPMTVRTQSIVWVFPPAIIPTPSPTQNPTMKPTSNPTKNPTKNPTNKPTQNPTVATLDIIMFYQGESESGGNIGDRDTSSQLCRTAANSQSLTCGVTPMLISYTSSTIESFPTTYGFTVSSTLRSRTNVPFGTWQTAIIDRNIPVNLCINIPGVACGRLWWTGIDSGVFRCNQWTSASGGGLGVVGSTSNTVSGWINSGTSSCNNANTRLCLCLPGVETPAPTNFPSRNPTKNPTSLSPTTTKPTNVPTSNPTKNPTQNPTKKPTANPTILIESIILFNSGASGSSNIGSRSSTTSTCSTRASVLGISCIRTPMLLSYSYSHIQDMPTEFMFPDSVPLFSISGLQIATSWDTAVSSGSLLRTVASAGVLAPTTSDYWTGYTPDKGDLKNCNDWSTTSALFDGRAGNGFVTNSLWLSDYPSVIGCGIFSSVSTLCMCLRDVVPTSSPTKSPTLNPSKKPSASPTQNPTKNPTENPTVKPTNIPTKNPTKNPTLNPTTVKPTNSPTKNPTKNPTQNPVPTTLSPTPPTTLKPTQAPFRFTTEIVLFEAGSSSNGNMGNRTTVNAVCAARALAIGYTDCFATPMLLDYFGGDIRSFPTQYDFNPSVNIVTPPPTSSIMQTDWGFLPSSVLVRPDLAGISTSPYFTGYSPSLSVTNCNGWTSSSSGVFGTYGQNNFLDSRWINRGTFSCDTVFSRLCICAR
jgi:hypothetical protein